MVKMNVANLKYLIQQRASLPLYLLCELIHFHFMWSCVVSSNGVYWTWDQGGAMIHATQYKHSDHSLHAAAVDKCVCSGAAVSGESKLSWQFSSYKLCLGGDPIHLGVLLNVFITIRIDTKLANTSLGVRSAFQGY